MVGIDCSSPYRVRRRRGMIWRYTGVVVGTKAGPEPTLCLDKRFSADTVIVRHRSFTRKSENPCPNIEKVNRLSNCIKLSMPILCYKSMRMDFILVESLYANSKQ